MTPQRLSIPWVPDLRNGTYQNPVLFADYSDPDAIRVGEDYWLTASSFTDTPGLPRSSELAELGILGRVSEILADPPAGGGEMGPDFERRLDDLVAFLGARPFFYADRPSRADLTAAAFLASLEARSVPGGPRLLRSRPELVRLLERVRAAFGRPPAPERGGGPMRWPTS